MAPAKVAVPFADFVNAPLPANTMETDALLNTVALLVTFTVSAFEMAKLEPVKTSLPVEPERLPPLLEMDTALLSKIEKGLRQLKRDQIPIIAEILKVNYDELMTLWLADQIYAVVKDEKLANEAMQVAEKNIKQMKKKNK